MKVITNFFKNNYKKIIAIVLAIIFVSVLGSFFENNNYSEKINIENIKYIKIAGQKIKVDIALSSEVQERGLSGRTSLKEDEGMLFIFKKPSIYRFWMKEMNFPIDMIWISEDLRVVYIKKNATPESYPETFTSTKDAKYVLEVFGLFSEKNNLREGDKVEFLSS
ncbi:MAG: DUF192 domain-containing protein [bacterium]